MGSYKKTIEDIENTWGTVPDFMKAFPEQSLVNEWPFWKKEKLSEIDMARASYLLDIDKMAGEMLEGQKITGKTMMEMELKVSYTQAFMDRTVMEELTGEVQMETDLSLPRSELIKGSMADLPANTAVKNRYRPFIEN